MQKNQKLLFVIGLLLLTGSAFAAADKVAPAVKTYKLKDLRTVVANHEQCKVFYQDLKKLTKKEVSLQFAASKNGGFAVQDASGQLSKHTHSTVKQSASGGTINRVGMGSFEYNKQQVDYVVEISANIENQAHKYEYPVILSSHNGHCYYTALIEPSEETVAAFKKSVKSGDAAKGNDLAKK